jgi:outer membrane receptor protein involved in Fe transport
LPRERREPPPGTGRLCATFVSHLRSQLASLIGLLVLAGEARADEAEDEALPTDIEDFALGDLINPTVTTATKSKLTLEQSPSIVTVFVREDIDRLGARQLIELLRYVPGFYEVASPLERNVAIRGIHGAAPTAFMVLLDGLPMNDLLFSSVSPEGFSLEYAERVEIIRGPGSAIYGANALMGVVNIITRKPLGSMSVRETLSVGTHGELRSDLSAGTELEQNRSFYTAFTFWTQGGSRFGVSPTEDVLTPSLGQNIADGIQPGENLSGPLAGAAATVNRYGPSFNALLKYQHSDGSTLRLFIARTESHLQRTYRQGLFIPDASTQAPIYVNERLVLDFEKKWGHAEKRGEVTLRLPLLVFGHDMRSQSITPAYYEAAGREGTPLVYRWSGRDLRIAPSLEYTVDLPSFGPFREPSLVAGVQAEYDVALDYQMTHCFLDKDHRFNPSVYAGDDKAGAPDLFCVQSLMLREGTTVDTFGAVTAGKRSRFGDGDEIRVGTFAQVTTLLPAGFALVAGGRVDYNVTYKPQLSPRIALVAPIAGRFYAKAQYSSSFVYPAFLYRNGNSLSDYQGNPDIKPQSIRTIEAMVGRKGGKTRLELNGYFNDVHDFITFDPVQNARTGQYRFSNQGNLRIVGAEATAMIRLLGNRLTADVQGTYAHPLATGTSPQFLVDGQLGGPTKYPELMARAVLSGSPVSRLRLRVDGSITSRVKHAIATEARFAGISGSDGVAYSSADAAAYDTRELVFNAAASYALREHWQVEAAGTNLLGRRAYRPGSVLVPYLAEGRQLTLRLSYQF